MTKNDEIIIRSACDRDAERMACLCEQLGYDVTRSQIQKRFDKLQSSEHHAVYVATLKTDEVIGWIHVHQCDLIIALIIMPPQAIVLGLVVDKSCRRCGIGKQLMEYIEKWARQKNCDAVLLRSNILRKKAHIFYQKIGYVNIK